MNTEEKIAHLSDQRALALLNLLAQETEDVEAPDALADQTEALRVVTEQFGNPLDLSAAPEPDGVAAGEAARRILLLMAGVPELEPRLTAELENTGLEALEALPLVIALPAVFTGCIVALQVAGHTKLHRGPDGKWTFDYDPFQQGPLDRVMKQIVTVLAGLMKPTLPGAGGS